MSSSAALLLLCVMCGSPYDWVPASLRFLLKSSQWGLTCPLYIKLQPYPHFTFSLALTMIWIHVCILPHIHTLRVYACIILIMYMYAFVCTVYIGYTHIYLYYILNKCTICIHVICVCVIEIDFFLTYFASFPSPHEGRGFHVLSLVSKHLESYRQCSVECSIVHSAVTCWINSSQLEMILTLGFAQGNIFWLETLVSVRTLIFIHPFNHPPIIQLPFVEYW